MHRSTDSFFFGLFVAFFVKNGSSLGMSVKRPLSWVILLFSASLGVQGMDFDSLRTEFENGKPFVVHQVEMQETLYSLSKRYFTSVEAIKQKNQLEGNELSLGAVLKIPWGKTLVHRVQPGETLFTLSQRYGISVAQLRDWNHLEDDNLSANQILTLGVVEDKLPSVPQLSSDQHIVAASETLYSIAKKYQLTLDQISEWNQLSGTNLNIGDTLWVAAPSSSSNQQIALKASVENEPEPSPVVLQEDQDPVVQPVPEPKTPVKAIKENGIAAVFEEDDTKKYLALHRTAPVGTIMQVRNEMTNLSVFVRVVGKLPDTGNNNNVLVRLSKSAQQGLGALDNRFRVELSYIPNQ